MGTTVSRTRITDLFALCAVCMALGGCPTGKPGDNGTVQNGTGGRSGNSMFVYDDDIQLFYDDEILQPTEQVGIAYKGDRVTVAPVDGGPVPPWLAISVDKSVQYFGSVTLTFQPQSDAPHTNTITLRFAASDADGTHVVYQDVPVTATREHRVSPQRQLMKYTVGMPANPSTRLELTANGLWKADADQPWTRLAATNGSGNASIDLAIDANTLAPGEHFSHVVFHDPVSGRDKTYWLLLLVDSRRLVVDQRGLAFSATLGNSRLTRELHITDTAGLGGHWQLSDDAAWLSANASTGAGDALVTLSADPTGLADGMHFGTVTISPNNEPGLTNTSVVRVGFHVDRSTPANSSIALEGIAPAGALAADPIRPWLYGFDRSGADTTLRVWNFHSGALIQSLSLPNVAVARARVAPDGRMLVVSDVDNRKFVVMPLDASVQAPLAPWTGMRFAGRFEDFDFTQLNGTDVIAWSAGQLLSADNGAVLAAFENFSTAYVPTTPPALSVAKDGRFLCMTSRASHGVETGALRTGQSRRHLQRHYHTGSRHR